MSRELKVLAITDGARSNWKVMVEIDRDTIHRLTGIYPDSQAPIPGTTFDVGEIIDKVSKIHEDSRQIQNIFNALNYFNKKNETNDPS